MDASQEINNNERAADDDASSMKKKKRKKGRPEGNKGLRHFSMKVCKKVEEKGVTTYNEVADDLVKEFAAQNILANEQGRKTYDEKNIRRRVYDALNVLMAMDIITKQKKEIRWRGLPSNAKHDLDALQNQRVKLLQSIQEKKAHLQELLLQQIAFKNLIARNSQTQDAPEETRIPLPFIIINTSNQTVIRCEMAEDRGDIFFNFSAPFEIHDDNEILKRLNLHLADPEELPKLIPRQLIPYLPETHQIRATSEDVSKDDKTVTTATASTDTTTTTTTTTTAAAAAVENETTEEDDKNGKDDEPKRKRAKRKR